MKRISRTCTKMLGVSMLSFLASVALMSGSSLAQNAEIIHDAEFYILKAQKDADWAEQDKELNTKLEALRTKYGKPPNIIHIMWDDTAVGEIGIPEIQKARGWETPQMNQLAADGINFMRMYTETSCTPTRGAIMTGRIPHRNGMHNVGFPYHYGGLAAEEVTIGEVLSEAGYATAFYGKAHLGDIEASYLTNQGFDEAMWSPYNQVPSLYTPQGQMAVLAPAVMMPEMFPEDPYDMDDGWRPRGYIWALEGTKGGAVREVGDPPDHDSYMELEDEFWKRSTEFIRKNAESEKPFFLALWPQLTSFLGFPDRATASGGLLQESLARMDVRVGEMIMELERLGIAENTLVILMADNGPMVHNGPVGMTDTLYRGGKGDYLDGALRVPAIAWWPGVIEPGQVVGDIIHATDLFTTFARLGGALDHVPTDRIIDGIDQTALFLEGDTHSRRDHVFIYTGDIFAAIVKGRYKRHLIGGKPGLSGPEFFDLYNDPREQFGMMLPMFPANPMFRHMQTRHLLWQERYPNRPMARDFPFKGVENARPETLRSSQSRVPAGELPFDPQEVVQKLPGWDNIDRDWGAGE